MCPPSPNPAGAPAFHVRQLRLEGLGQGCMQLLMQSQDSSPELTHVPGLGHLKGPRRGPPIFITGEGQLRPSTSRGRWGHVSSRPCPARPASPPAPRGEVG